MAPVVLSSRWTSCTRKSIRLPTGPCSPSALASAARWLSSRTISSVTSPRSASIATSCAIRFASSSLPPTSRTSRSSTWRRREASASGRRRRMRAVSARIWVARRRMSRSRWAPSRRRSPSKARSAVPSARCSAVRSRRRSGVSSVTSNRPGSRSTSPSDGPPVSRSVCTSSRTAPTYARASPGCIATRYRRSAAIGARSTVTSTRPRCAVFRTRSRISVSHAAYSRGTATLTSRKRWLRPRISTVTRAPRASAAPAP